MKKMKIVLGVGIVMISGLLLIAADHIDAPDVAGGKSDITDYYAFQGEDTDNIVFVANLEGFLSPGTTADASFDENVLVEFNIDTDGDNVEDLVIQATPRGDKMYFFGPVAPSNTGLNSTLLSSANAQGEVTITAYGSDAVISNNSGMNFFAGPRDDPFFMDFSTYSAIIGGTASGFNNPGADTFAGTNTLSIVVEVPKSMIGGTGTINTWVESKRKQ